MAGNEEYDEEMEAERELADSAMWKVIQKNTFTRWTNEHLKHTKLQIVDMEKDFSDGLKLIALIEALSGKKFAKFNKKPSFRTQKFENVTMSLKFLEDKEGIKLVNIDSSDIVDHKLKLIMGLIWTLILHYSITMPTWEDEGGFGKDLTPKQRLLAWIQNKIPEKNITNFTSDWNDGTAIAALVDAVAPGLVPDWANLLPANKVQNAKDAMDLAEKFLDVPQVIKPDEMCNPKVDELSMMTYLSRFPSAKIKPGAPVQQKPNAQRIKAYGPGIEPQGNVVGAPARFIVETASAGKGDLEVIVLDPKGKQEKVELLPNNDRTQSYNCVYTPSVDGAYTVSIKFAGQPSTKQPYLVNVAPKNKAGDPGKVVAQGPGVEKSGVMVNRKTYFDVITKGAGVGVVDVGVFDPQGKPLKATVTKKSDDMWYVEYTAEVPGLHSVNVNFAGLPIPKSPYPVGVGTEGGPPVDASRLPGKPKVCTPRDAAANSLATPLKAAPGSTAPVAEQPQQQLKPMPGKAPAPGEVPEDQGAGPSTAAKPGAPPAQIPIDAKKCWASGRGIQPKGVRLGDLADFKIHTENAGNAEPRAMVMGPGGTPVQATLKKLDDVTYECVYKPAKPGLHIVNVTFAGQQIPKSPFKVDVGPLKTSKVVAFGPGLESGVVNQPAKFTVQPNGEGPIGFKIEGPSQAKIEVTKNPQQTEMYVSYLPTAPGEYAIRILSNNDDIPKSPFIADIRPVGEAPVTPKPAPGQAAAPEVDASKVTAFGPGLEKEGNVVNKWAEFTVDATKAGQAPLVVTVTDAENKNVELTAVDNKNLTFSCKYLPLKATRHTVKIVYGGKEVPKSPFLVNVKDAGVGASRVKVYGPAIEKPVQAKILSYYMIDCKEAGPGEPQVTLTNDKGQPINFQKKDLRDRTYRVEFTAVVAGVYKTNVTFANQPVPRSPFAINVLGGPDASRVKVYGPALEAPVNVNELTYFVVDCKEAGPGEPRVVLLGEKVGAVATKIVDQTDRTYKVEFTAPVAGLYNANVQFASSPVPKSPFRITAQASIDIRQVFVKDLPEFVPVNKEVVFEVVTAGAGPGKVKVVIASPTGKSVPVRLDEKPNVTTVVKFIPMEPGPYKIEVFFSEKPVANSPFQVTAEAANPFKVKVYGPAIEKPVFASEVTYFVVDYKEAGPGEPQVKIVDEKGAPVPFHVLDQKDKTHRIELTPATPGSLTVTVVFAGQQVPKSPFKITVQVKLDTSKVKVYGPALEKPVTVRYATYFVVDCKEAGPGIPDYNLATEDGHQVESKFNDNKDGTFTIEFTPQSFSPIIAYVNFLGQAAPKSPYKIIIHVDVSKVKVYGPAVEGPVAPKIPTHFTVDCKEVGPGIPKVTLTDDKSAPVPFTLNDNKDGTYQVDFIPEVASPLTAGVLFADQPVPKSPFKISVMAGMTNPSKVKISGPAFEGPVAPKQPTHFNVDCKEAGPGKPKVSITDDNKTPVPFTVKDNKDGTYTTELTPESLVPLTAVVTFADQPVPQSPFKITSRAPEAIDASKVKLSGPAVEGPVKSNLPTFFNIDAKEAGPAKPEVALATVDNKPVKASVVDNKDGTYKVDFVPREVKPIVAQVKMNNTHVPKSPCKVVVEPGPVVEPSKVKIYGPATEGPVKSSQPTYFIVDAKDAGPGTPEITLATEDATPIKPHVTDNKDGTYKADFVPVVVQPIMAQVVFADEQVPKSPFKIQVVPGASDASKVKLSGPAVEGPVKAEEPTYFVVDAKEAGPGKPDVKLTADNGVAVPTKLKDNHDGTHVVEFVPESVVPITAAVNYAAQPVPKSPFKISVQPKTGRKPDASKVKLFGPAVENPVKCCEPTYFMVDASEAGPGHPEITLAYENGSPVKPVISDGQDNKYKVDFVPTLVQPITARVLFAGEHVPKSPLKISVEPTAHCDTSKVHLYGPATEGPVKANQPTYFVIDAKEAGPGHPEVMLTTEDGSAVKPQLADNHDGTYKVEFVPVGVKPITAQVKYAGSQVPKSPFKIPLEHGVTDISKVKLSGPAVEGPVKSQEPTHFVVDAKEAGPGQPLVTLTADNGAQVPAKIIDKHDATFVVTFTPEAVVPITADVKFNNKEVPKSPFKVAVEQGAGTPSEPAKVKLYGPAVEGPVKANEPTYFVVDAKEAGPGHPEVSLFPENAAPLKPIVTDNKDGTFKAAFVPLVPKPIVGQVKFAEKQVPKSPFKIQVEPSKPTDASKVKIFGPAAEGPVKANQPTYFVVDAKEAGPGFPEVALTVDDGSLLKPKIEDDKNGTYKVEFLPVSGKPITAQVKYAGTQVPKSPFKIPVQSGAVDASKVKLRGPAVEGPVKAQEPTYFVVDAKEAGSDKPEVKLTAANGSPVPAKIKDNHDGTFIADFVPEAVAPITAEVKFAGQQVPKSPVQIQVVPSSGKKPDATKVKLYGPAIEGPVKPDRPTYFMIDAKEAGPGGHPVVELMAEGGTPLKPMITDNKDGTFKVDFVPTVVKPVIGQVKYFGQQVPKSPFKIPVDAVTAATAGAPDVNKVKVYGPAVERPVQSQEPTYFVVDAKEAGPVDEPNVSVVKPDGTSLPVQKTDKRDGTYRVDFTPQDAGVVLSHVKVAGRPVNGSPFKTTIQAKSQKPAKVAAIPKVMTVGKTEPINIQLEGPKRGPATVDLITPHGNVLSSPVYDKPDGYLGQVTATEPGPHKIVVKVANEPVEGSPFDVEVVPSSLTFTPSDVIDASKVKVYGSGLAGGTTNKPCDFTIDTSAAGPGNLGLTIDGPTEAKIECFDKGNGVFDVRYLPNEPGEYTINVTFDDKSVPHSPFKAQINPEILVDVSRVRTFGPGIQPQGVYLDSVTEFTIDTATVQPKGIGNVKVILTNPSGTLTEAIVNKSNDDTYTCLYTPFEEGPTKIDVTYDGLKVPGSPFVTNVTPGCDPSKVKVYGQGVERGEPNKPQKFVINTRGAGVGGVGLSVVGPTEPQVDCTDNQDGTLSVEYLPETPGDYEIGVTFADQPVPGSPFIVPIGEAVKPFYPDRVKCFGPGLNPQGVRQGQRAVFSVVTNQAGEAPLDVMVTELNTGAKLPVRANKNPSGTFDVEYEPHNEGPIRIDVLYGKIPVPGSPFNTVSKPFVDLSKVTIAGEGVKPQVPASLPMTFSVDTRAAAPAPLPVDVDVKTPQGKVIKPTITAVAPGVTQVNYTPEDAGPYQIHVKVAGQEVPNSPLRVTAVPTGNPEKVTLPDSIPPSVAPNQTFTFKVQKPAAAGPGSVSCKVTKAGQPGFPATEIPCTVQDNHDGTVLVSYPVPEEGVIVVETKFGGVPVPRGRFTQKVGRPGEPTLAPLIPTSIATGEMSPHTPQSPVTPISPSAPLRPVEVTSIPVGPDLSQVSAVVIKPSGESLPVQIVETEKGTVRVNYSPTETGLHHLKVLYAGQPVPGDPFNFYVHAPVPGQVTAFGPGLVSGSVNQPCVFTVVTKNAGKGGLSLAIEGPSKADIKCKDNRDGSATITYVPTTPGEYKVVVKHGGQPIAGAPFVAKITGEDRTIFTRTVTTTEQSTVTRQSHVTVGSTRHLSIQVTESDLSNLSALIRSPSGVEEPCGLKRQPSGQLGISFTPKESGEHLVIVFRNGQPIPGSPFRVFIQAAEVGDAARVKVYGENLTQGKANEINSFTINTKEAGVAGLSISVQGPGKVDIKCTENEDGTTKVTYKPTEPGIYHVTIKYSDKPVPGSPFTINVGGVPSGRVKERIVRQQQAATMTSVGTTCELNITMPGINVHEIEGSVASPSGQIEKCQIIDLGSNKFRISFSPKESGIHYVSLKHKGLHIPGSPFQFTVGPIVGGGPEKVRAVGPGLVRGEANKPCHFTVITREAGAGSLSLGVEGPSKAVIDFQDRKDGTSDVNYICSEPGEYLVSVKFNGQHIPDSPFKVYISSTGGDINKLNVQNLQQQGLPVNMQTQFLVEFNGAQGKLDARVVAPSGQESEATVQEIRPGHFSIVFVPKESGVHYVHLLLNGNHIPGSPYPVQVGVVNADPSKVRAYGEGLHHGQSGQPCRFVVNTTESGPGALSVGISGPSKVEMQTREVDEGYEFTYTPLAPGPYLITIKYAGNAHIPGSPFKAQIEGVGTPAAFAEQSRVIVETVTKTTTSSITSHQGELICDVSKVLASGAGLSQSTVSQDTLFTVDGSQAGYNVLHVGVAGPHIPVDKVFINHLGDLRYSVRYQVSQPGRYLIYVKWGEQHIPGSPFVVMAK